MMMGVGFTSISSSSFLQSGNSLSKIFGRTLLHKVLGMGFSNNVHGGRSERRRLDRGGGFINGGPMGPKPYGEVLGEGIPSLVVGGGVNRVGVKGEGEGRRPLYLISRRKLLENRH